MDAAIILAGGQSRRSGRQHKACRRLHGDDRSWIDRQVDILRQAGFAPVYLVTGYRPRRVLACLHRRAMRRHNFRARRGPFSTLQLGLQNPSGPALVVPVDAILPPAPWLRRLRRSAHARNIAAASPIDRWGGGGHPLMLSQCWSQMAWMPPPTQDRQRGVSEGSPRLNRTASRCQSGNLPTRRTR
ncbi:MAG: nucleotidyltransferase family protein, partial [Acidithiobacillus sp.]